MRLSGSQRRFDDIHSKARDAPEQPVEEVRPSRVGHEADADEAGDEARVVGSDADVAHARQREPGARAHTVDGGDDGLLQRADREHVRVVALAERVADIGLYSENSFRSWPAEKPRPAPVSTTARTSGSRASFNASRSAACSARLNAFSTSGRFSVIVWTLPSRVTSTSATR